MKDYTTEQIQAQFEKLPKELQKAISSQEVLNTIQAIGKKYELMIDQVGDLVDQVVLVILGFAKASTFVSDLSDRLSIDAKLSQMIATDINSQVFSTIKTQMREIEEKSKKSEDAARAIDEQTNDTGQQDIAALEQPLENDHAESTMSSVETAGDFSIDRPSSILESSSGITVADRAKILAGVEDPTTCPSILENPPKIEESQTPINQKGTLPLTVPKDSQPSIAAIPNATTPVPAAPQPVVPKPVPPPTPQTPKKIDVSNPKPGDPYKESVS